MSKFQGHVSLCNELMSRVWPVNTQFQKVSKSGFFQTQLEAIQEHLSSYCAFQKHARIQS